MKYVRMIVPWVVVAAVAYFAFRFLKPLFLPQEEEMDVQTVAVERGDLRKIVPADGVLKPSVLVEVKSKASGVVQAVMVEPGDDVKVGDILVELDKEQINAQLRQAEASLLSSQAELEKIKRSLSPQQLASQESSVRQAQLNYDTALEHFNRINELYQKGFATEEELETAKTELSTAEEQLKQAKTQLELDLAGGEKEDISVAEANVAIRQAELDDVKEELANTTIRSAINGRVLTRPVEVGTAVASGTSGMGDGTVVATIGDLSTLYVEANMDETDLGRVTLGMPCRVSFDAYVGYVWSGTLKKVYPQGEANEGGGTRFPVDVELSLTPQLEESGEGGGAGGQSRGGGPGGPPPGGGGGKIAKAPGGAPGGPGGPGGAPGGVAAKPAGEAKEEAPPELRPNMTANVEFVLEDHPDVLILSAKFIQYTDDRKPYVEVLPDPADQETREKRDVELGFTDGLRFEVLSGISEGETVIVEKPIKKEERPI